MERYLANPHHTYGDDRAIIAELIRQIELRDEQILQLQGNVLFARHELDTLRKLAIAADDHLRRATG